MRRITLRMTEEQWLALQRLADMECRSMSQQAIHSVVADAWRKGVFTPIKSRPALVKASK